MTEVGRVAETWVYPFKSMKGVSLDEITVRSVSVQGDRRRAYLMQDTRREFAWLTTEQFPEMLQYSPYFVDPDSPGKSEIRVITPNGDDFSADSKELLEEISDRSKRKISLVKFGRAAYHSMPVSVISYSSVNLLSRQLGFNVDIRRFRQNIVMATADQIPFEEHQWTGRFLIFGNQDDGARLLAVKPDGRCMTVNLDPDTAEQSPAVLRTVVKHYDNKIGLYATPAGQSQGNIRVGDKIYLADSLSV